MHQPITQDKPHLLLAIRRKSGGLLRRLRPRVMFARLGGILPNNTFHGTRRRIYRLAGCDLAEDVAILGRLRFTGSGDILPRLHIAEGCIVAPDVVVNLDGDITIGRNVTIGPFVKLYTASHGIGFGSRRYSEAVRASSVTVEDGVWVGMDSLILPGVVLGRGSVVAAGSVVSKSVAPNTLVAGNPATVQKDLPFGDR